MMASSSAITTRVLTVGSSLRSCGLGHESVEQLVLGALETGDPLEQLGAVSLHGLGVPLGLVMLPIGQGCLRDERAQSSIVGCLGEVGQLILGDAELVAQLLEARRGLGEAAFDERSGHRGQCMPGAPRAPDRTWEHLPVPRNHPRATRRLTAVIAAALMTAGCEGSGGSERACGPVVREPLDPASVVHVLGDGPDVTYETDPPTSGPHAAAPQLAGVRREPLSRPVQVGILERGDVLFQFDPALPAPKRTRLEALAGEGIVVAPNADLPTAIVATSWTYTRRCTDLDVGALRAFIRDRAGKGPS